jgi:hypothetical protein
MIAIHATSTLAKRTLLLAAAAMGFAQTVRAVKLKQRRRISVTNTIFWQHTRTTSDIFN